MEKIMIGLSALLFTLFTCSSASAYGHANAWAADLPPTQETPPRAPMRMAAAQPTPQGRGLRLPTPMADRPITLRVQARPPPATATVALRLTPRGRGLRLPTATAARPITLKVLAPPRQPMPTVAAPLTMRAKEPSVRLLPARPCMRATTMPHQPLTTAIIHPRPSLSMDPLATTAPVVGVQPAPLWQELWLARR